MSPAFQVVSRQLELAFGFVSFRFVFSRCSSQAWRRRFFGQRTRRSLSERNANFLPKSLDHSFRRDQSPDSGSHPTHAPTRVNGLFSSAAARTPRGNVLKSMKSTCEVSSDGGRSFRLAESKLVGLDSENRTSNVRPTDATTHPRTRLRIGYCVTFGHAFSVSAYADAAATEGAQRHDNRIIEADRPLQR